MCIEISTELEALDLLKVCMMVEQQLHRVRNERWDHVPLILIYYYMINPLFNHQT